MKPLHELYDATSGFELLLENGLKALKRHRDAMYKEKDASKIKDILKTLENLEYDVARYRDGQNTKQKSCENKCKVI